MQGLPWANGIRDQAGYVPMAPGARLCEGAVVDAGSFRRWDCGFDFYAPQTFVDESGRTLLIAWMGLPEADFESAPDGMTWCHCLTVPREVTAGAGGARSSSGRQQSSRRCAARGTSSRRAGRSSWPSTVPTSFSAASRARSSLRSTDALRVLWGRREHSRCALRTTPWGCGRTERTTTCDDLRDLRVLIDSSAVEVFANDGELAFATRWFPRAPRLALRLDGGGRGAVWEMGDGMEGTYDLV